MDCQVPMDCDELPETLKGSKKKRDRSCSRGSMSECQNRTMEENDIYLVDSSEAGASFSSPSSSSSSLSFSSSSVCDGVSSSSPRPLYRPLPHPSSSPNLSNMLCFLCGVAMQPNPCRMCARCLRFQVDISEGISKQVILPQCRTCERFLLQKWLICDLESKQLLALCLKKIRGLSKVKLVDASFIWTEPHSRRMKVKVTVQKEVLQGTILQQTFTVEFFLQSCQCEDCKASYTPHIWGASVQVRQRTNHKRSFLYLEQLILKHDAHQDVINIVERPDGLDFHFSKRGDGQRLLDFISEHFSVRTKLSKQLISHDATNNTTNNKYSTYCELCPICKDDLVFLPPKVASIYGGISPLLVCSKVSTNIQFLDPFTLRLIDVAGEKYWRYQFDALFSRKQLSEFIVLDVEIVDVQTINTAWACKRVFAENSKYQLVDVEIARASDFGKNDERLIVRSHLGKLLKAGDWCAAYDLRTLNVSGFHENAAKYIDKVSNDVVIVKKIYRRKDDSSTSRPWTLQQLPKSVDSSMQGGSMLQQKRDMEDFKIDLEEDVETRRNINLWKDPKYVKPKVETEMTDDEEEAIPQVELCELLDGLTLEGEGEEKGGEGGEEESEKEEEKKGEMKEDEEATTNVKRRKNEEKKRKS